ncbi:MAG: hypothetical protein MAG453_00789 [Calditrichaeota bacterium]|nr:hypothetical protein [Calditrichota bacterium]
MLPGARILTVGCDGARGTGLAFASEGQATDPDGSMKFLSYARRIHGRTAYIHGGKALDFDLDGGLEEVMKELIERGARRIVLTLGPMRFLHYTLFAGLLATQRRLDELGGDLILAEVPWFVELRLRELGVAHRFAIVPHAATVERAQRITVDLDAARGPTVIPGGQGLLGIGNIVSS